nr:MAG TPA: peroxidase [Caudoviricetes sp.]
MEFLDMNFYMAQVYYLGLVLLHFGATYCNC